MFEGIISSLTETIWHLFIFVALSTMFVYIASKYKKVVSFLTTEKHSNIQKAAAAVVLSFVLMITIFYSTSLNDFRLSTADIIAMVSSIIAGPVAGLFATAVGAISRFLIGGSDATGAALSIIVSGLVGAYLWRIGYKIKTITYEKITNIMLIAGVLAVVHTSIIIPILSADFLNTLSQSVMPLISLMLINIFGIGIILLLCKDIIDSEMFKERLEAEAERWKNVAEALQKYKEAKAKPTPSRKK